MMCMWFVYKCLTDVERDGLRWPVLSGLWLSCIGNWLYLLSMKLSMWDNFSAHIHLPRLFLSMDYLYKKCFGQVTSDLLDMRFAYNTKDNQQGCSRLSNWFSLWCMGPWMNHLPPVWWSTFRFRFLIVSWYESLIWWSGIFLFDFLPLLMFYTLLKFCWLFFLILIYS